MHGDTANDCGMVYLHRGRFALGQSSFCEKQSLRIRYGIDSGITPN